MNEFRYRFEIDAVAPEDGGGFVAYYPTIGRYAMNGVGDTAQEALDSLQESREAVLEFVEENDLTLPAPTAQDFIQSPVGFSAVPVTI